MRVSLRFGPRSDDTKDMIGGRSYDVGQALVEFALVVTALMLIVVGIFEFGRAVEAYTEISNGAREGARYASVHPDDLDGARAAALAKIVLAAGATATASNDGETVTVRVEYDFQSATPLIGIIRLSSSATMRIEGVPG